MVVDQELTRLQGWVMGDALSRIAPLLSPPHPQIRTEAVKANICLYLELVGIEAVEKLPPLGVGWFQVLAEKLTGHGAPDLLEMGGAGEPQAKIGVKVWILLMMTRKE